MIVFGLLLLLVIVLIISFFKSKFVDPNVNREKSPEQMKFPVYRPFKDGPFQMTMGIRALNLNQWIEIDPSYRHEIELKRELLRSSRRNDLFLYKDEAFAACKETLELLIDHLPKQFPNMFRRNSIRTRIENLITGDSFDLNEMNDKHPLEIASLLVQEDLVIMQFNPDDEKYYANALSVCFPSGWLPRRKFSLPMTSIHVPHVPFFKEKLSVSVEKYFLKLKVENPIQRLNWTIQIGNQLCHTDMDEAEDVFITKDNAGQRVYLRVERQTLRRLPKSNTILFTIKTYTTKIEDVARDDPETAKRLAGALRYWPAEMLRYKDAHRYMEGLLAYLDQSL